MNGGDDSESVRYSGAVKKLIPAGHGKPAIGFIECPETAELFEGRDVFVNDQLATQLEIGQTVSFSIQLNAKGHPQAVNVAAEDGTVLHVDHSQPTLHVPQNDTGKGKGKVSNAAHSQSYGPTGQRLYQVLLPEVGPALEWGLQKSVAKALVEAGEALGVADEMRGLMGNGNGFGKASLGGKGYGAAPYQAAAGGWGKATAGKSKPPATDGMSQPYVGQVKKIQTAAQTGRNHSIGFVHCDEILQLYGKDVFLNSEQADSLTVGQTVHFDVVLNKTGQPQAVNLTLSDAF